MSGHSAKSLHINRMDEEQPDRCNVLMQHHVAGDVMLQVRTTGDADTAALDFQDVERKMQNSTL